jgi:hypothetical protein
MEVEVVSENAASRPSSSWVVDMETMLEHTDDDPSAAERVRWNRRSIYRVPEGMKQQTKSEAYRPLFVSLGPFHHGDPRLVPMEEHKRRAVLHLVKGARRPLRDFVAAMEEVADELLDAYGDDLGEQWHGGRDRFLEVMLADGCFLLEMMRTHDRVHQGKKVKDYAPNDPVFSIHGFYFLRPHIQSDLLLMENQLPLLVLQRILVVQHGISAPVCASSNLCLMYLYMYKKGSK